YTFTVAWPQNAGGKTSKVMLGFQAETDAARWQSTFLQSVLRLAEVQAVQGQELALPVTPSSDSILSVPKSSYDNICARELPAEIPEQDAVCEEPAVADGGMETATQWKQMQDMRAASSSGCTTSSSDAAPEASNAGNGATVSSGMWSPWKHVNGVPVYREEEDSSDGSGGAFMVSAVIRCPPHVCFKALMETNPQASCVTGLFEMELLEQLDENSETLHAQLEGSGWLNWLLSPRDVVVQRTWRQEEEDGTYVVLLHSVDRHIAVDQRDQMPSLWSWLRAPVRAQVSAAGFTIAPLKDCGQKQSPESLVTMVLKMDFGGSVSQNCILHPIFDLLGIRYAWIESMLMTVVRLRDRVEHARFVTLPFSASGAFPSRDGPRRTAAAMIRDSQAGATEDISASKPREGDANEEEESARVVSSAGTMDPKYWARPGAAGFKLRGANYLRDKKKELADEPVFDLVSVDLVKIVKPTPHIARYLPSIQCSSAAFSYVVQIMIPGPPHLAMVMTWGANSEAFQGLGGNEHDSKGAAEPRDTELETELTPFALSLMRFVTGTDEYRNGVFKLIPKIVKGSWIVRQSVGSTPVLLGRKLKQYYFSGRGVSNRYFEVDIDVGSSYTAASVVGLVSGATKSLVVDLAILSEGKRVDELPEALIGTVRFQNLDLGTAVPLDTSAEYVPPESDQSRTEEQQSKTAKGS
ncbi:unnamed protein product, partial [Ostreobium quekettii]